MKTKTQATSSQTTLNKGAQAPKTPPISAKLLSGLREQVETDQQIGIKLLASTIADLVSRQIDRHPSSEAGMERVDQGAKNMSAGSPPTRPSSPTIPELIEHTEGVLNHSHELLGELTSILTPILQPESPAPNGANATCIEELYSPVADRMLQHARGIRSLNHRIMALIERAALPK